MIRQLPLALRWPRRQRFDCFYASSNRAALDAVRKLACQPGAPWVYLQGTAGSGKSHLLMAACQVTSENGCRVQYLPLANLDNRVAMLRGCSGSSLLALDDLGAIAGDLLAEEALFELYNRASLAGTALLFADRLSPVELGLVLPDLCSRLGACVRFSLKPLTDSQRCVVLKEKALMRGMVLDDTVLDWLFSHYARDLGTLLDLFEQLDYAALAAQRRITVPFLRGFLNDMGTAQAIHTRDST